MAAVVADILAGKVGLAGRAAYIGRAVGMADMLTGNLCSCYPR